MRIKNRLFIILLVVLIATIPVTVSADTSTKQVDDEVHILIDNMPIEDKVAQLFILTPEVISGEDTITAGVNMKEFLKQYPVSGMICFENNIISEDQIKNLLSNTQKYNDYQMFFRVDEEGGSVTRLTSKLGLLDVGTAKSIGDTKDASVAYKAGATLGTYLKTYGFNVDFAPVADVGLVESSVINTRYYSSDAYVAADMVQNVVSGIEEQGISATLKHFPGHGSTSDDSHSGLAITYRTLDEMYESEFLPFESGIESGADFVMVGHISAPNATPDNDMTPASLNSFFVTDILRNSLGYNGIIVTDAMNMGAITQNYTSAEAAVMAIEAGVDQILMPDDFIEAYNAVLSAVKNGDITEERIDESLERIYSVKHNNVCVHDYTKTVDGGLITYVCNNCGYTETNYIDGVLKSSNGNWYYYKNGKIDNSYTGFAENENGKWYIENGKVTFIKQGIIKDTNGALGDKGAWYYVIGSKVQTSFNGLSNFSNENGWWYIKNGKVDFSANTVAKNKNGWYYITGGKVQFGFTGLANYKNKNGWWYIRNGKVDFSHNGVDKNKNGWWYVENGKVNFDYTNKVSNYKNSKVDFSYNGKARNKNGIWNVKNGKVKF